MEVKSSADPPPKVPAAKQAHTTNRKQRCGECSGCIAQDCGECRYCLNMRKFGGPGTLKQPCISRRCVGDSMSFDGPPAAKKPKNGGSANRSFPVQQRAPQHKDKESGGDGFADMDSGVWGSLHIAALYSEGYEPFDPDVSAAMLDKCGHLGYDAKATHFYCALDGGVALSRCESMEEPPAGDALAAQNAAQVQLPSLDAGVADGQKSSEWDRARILANVTMEPGIRAMDMMPLPTWIEGEGEVGGYSRPLLASYESYFAAQNALRVGQEPAYGDNFTAPEPYRNARGELIVVVHKSRMTNLRLSAFAPGAPNAPPTVSSSSSLPATTSPAEHAAEVAVVAAGKNEAKAKESKVVSDNEGMSDAETRAESDTESALDLLRKAASGHSPTD